MSSVMKTVLQRFKDFIKTVGRALPESSSSPTPSSPTSEKKTTESPSDSSSENATGSGEDPLVHKVGPLTLKVSYENGASMSSPTSVSDGTLCLTMPMGG